ncbi:MAG: nucleotide exchange factor GrpE [Chamaesiphon sp.]|nr:nucleotide exchange factor GrpE [Chamaesiphon sp.]
MSETVPQPNRPDDEHTSSQPSSENLESTPTGTVSSSPTESVVADAETAATTEAEASAPIGAVPSDVVEPETPEPPESELQSLAIKLTEITNQRDAFQSQYLRIAADFDNFRKRSGKEKEEIELRVKCATIMELLSVVDNFERARTQIKPQNDGEMGIHKSYQSVYKQLVDSLKRIGVSPMRSEGQQFDPNLHEAVMRQPTEEHPEGTVIEELQRGYYLGDRILRHSLVKVAAPPEQLSAEDATDFGSAENS